MPLIGEARVHPPSRCFRRDRRGDFPCGRRPSSRRCSRSRSALRLSSGRRAHGRQQPSRGRGRRLPRPCSGCGRRTTRRPRSRTTRSAPAAGSTAITNKQVDFGASDAPLTPDQFGCLPVRADPGADVGDLGRVQHPGRIAGLNITGKILADIYLGKIDFWDNPQIKKINKGKTIPHLKITPVFRSDGSGTTYNFTDYLSNVSREFKNKVGNATQVSFPAGVGARGSNGVSSTVKQTAGGVTYVDVAYSLKNHLKFFRVQNQREEVHDARHPVDSVGGLARQESAVEQRAAHRQPACNQEVRERVSDLHLHVGRSCRSRATHAGEVKSFIKWALTKGQHVDGRAEAPVRPDSQGGREGRHQDAQQDPLVLLAKQRDGAAAPAPSSFNGSTPSVHQSVTHDRAAARETPASAAVGGCSARDQGRAPPTPSWR